MGWILRVFILLLANRRFDHWFLFGCIVGGVPLFVRGGWPVILVF